MTDRNAQVLDPLTRLLCEEIEETARDAVGRLGIERHRFVGHSLYRNTAHIAAIGELEQILFGYRHMITPLQDSFLLFSFYCYFSLFHSHSTKSCLQKEKDRQQKEAITHGDGLFFMLES